MRVATDFFAACNSANKSVSDFVILRDNIQQKNSKTPKNLGCVLNNGYQSSSFDSQSTLFIPLKYQEEHYEILNDDGFIDCLR